MFKKIATGAIISGLALGMVAPSFALAQSSATTTDTARVTELRAQIAALLAQITELQARIADLKKQTLQAQLEIASTTNVGSQGDNVKLLQLYLAQDPTLYPEGLVTGYFGAKTLKALERYEAKYGDNDDDDDGDDDNGKKNHGKNKSKGKDKQREKALEKINKSLRNGSWIVVKSATDPNTCVVTPPGHFVAPGYAKNFGKPISVPCKDLPPGIQRLLNGTVTPPAPSTDTTAPTFSSVTVGTLTATTAMITATTSEPTTVRAQYGTTTAYGATTAFGTLGTTTALTLSGLTPSTTYHFVLHARDAAGNTATTTDAVFTTTAAPDTTAPVISSAQATSTTATSSTITWTTNEPASSKVYYGTTTPLALGSALSIFNPSLTTNHSVALSGLTASTTHYYVIESKDAAGNTATSTESSFATLP